MAGDLHSHYLVLNETLDLQQASLELKPIFKHWNDLLNEYEKHILILERGEYRRPKLYNTIYDNSQDFEIPIIKFGLLMWMCFNHGHGRLAADLEED